MDPTIRAQLKKVEVVGDPEVEKVFPALQRVIVNIKTTDGLALMKADVRKKPNKKAINRGSKK